MKWSQLIHYWLSGELPDNQIDELLKQQHDLERQAIKMFRNGELEEAIRMMATAERIKRKIAAIEYGKLSNGRS